MPGWVEALTVAEIVQTGGAIAAVVGAVVGFVKVVHPRLRRAMHLVDDFLGEAARPGVPARPGVMEQLACLARQVKDVQHNVKGNDGSSAHDELVRQLTQIVGKLDALAVRMDESEADQRALRGVIDHHLSPQRPHNGDNEAVEGS